MSQRATGDTDAIYYPGDEVIFKEKDKSKWSGPAKVTDIVGNKIRMIFGGYERTVPSIDVAHYKDTKTVTETNEHKEQETQTPEAEVAEGWESTQGLPEDWHLERNSTIRPKLHDEVEFIVRGCLRAGRVVRVGKQTGKDKCRCWIRNNDGETSYDFLKDVEHWRKVPMIVSFEDENVSKRSTAVSDKEDVGVFHLKNWHTVISGLEDKDIPASRMEGQNIFAAKVSGLVEEDSLASRMEAQNVFAAEVPKKYHNDPKIVEAKEEEMRRWNEYDTVEQVTQTNNMQVISSRWVVTEKESGKYKARLVVRGFEETVYPQSDSPTASRDSFKTFLALAANEEMQIKNMDVKSAFLQGTPLDREVFMEPPSEYKKTGIVWKLKKTVYGLYDGSRSWYFAVKDELKSLGMKSISGDDAFFTMSKTGELFGMTVLHVDDFLVAGRPEFLSMISFKLKKRFTFGKTEYSKFKFTGLNIDQQEEGIYVDQIDYIQNIQPISSYKLEFKAYRGLTGQLNWAVENTRPDLAFDVRHLATRNKSATISDIKNANKILKRATYENVKVKYSRLGHWKDLKLVTYTDSSFKNSEYQIKSVGGRVTFLTNSQGMASPLSWKSKTIQQVCKSVKSAETRSLEQGLEDCIYTSRFISEIMTGKSGSQIPVEHKIDSKTLHDSIVSTKPIEEKTMRHLIAWIKQQQYEYNHISKITWIPNHLMLADILTKKGVKSDALLCAVMKGQINS